MGEAVGDHRHRCDSAVSHPEGLCGCTPLIEGFERRSNKPDSPGCGAASVAGVSWWRSLAEAAASDLPARRRSSCCGLSGCVRMRSCPLHTATWCSPSHASCARCSANGESVSVSSPARAPRPSRSWSVTRRAKATRGLGSWSRSPTRETSCSGIRTCTSSPQTAAKMPDGSWHLLPQWNGVRLMTLFRERLLESLLDKHAISQELVQKAPRLEPPRLLGPRGRADLGLRPAVSLRPAHEHPRLRERSALHQPDPRTPRLALAGAGQASAPSRDPPRGRAGGGLGSPAGLGLTQIHVAARCSHSRDRCVCRQKAGGPAGTSAPPPHARTHGSTATRPPPVPLRTRTA